MHIVSRFLIISFALFCVTAPITACKSKGGGESGQTPQSSLITITRRAFLNDKQEVAATPVESSATGTATVTLDTATSRLTGTVFVSNVTDAAVYISDGDAGSNGGLIVGLEETPPGSGTWTIPDSAAALQAAQADRFKAAGFYVNVATLRLPDGEIRGQLLSYADDIQPVFDQHCIFCHKAGGAAASTGLFLDQNQSYSRLVNQLATQSSGTRVIPFDAANSVLFRRTQGIGLSPMPPGGPLLSSRDENLIRAWINMGAIDDSGAFPQPASPQIQFVRRAFLNANQVASAAPVVSAATGAAALTLDAAKSRLTGTVTLSNVSNAVASVHISDADAGSNGAPVVSLTETPAGSGVWTVPETAVLTPTQRSRFIAAGFYVSVDTAPNANGEIRGQLLSYADNIQPMFSFNCVVCHYALGADAFVGMMLTATDSFASLVNQPATQSTGARVVPFDADNSVLFQRISGTGFSSVVGSQMPPDFSFLPPLPQRDQNLIKVWINMGAIDNNGVVQSPQPVTFRQDTRNAFLNAVQAVPALSSSSSATGTAKVILDTAASKLTGTVVISNMTNIVTTVTINDGDADNNGTLVVSLSETPAGSGIWTIPATEVALTDVQMNRFIAAGLYVSAVTAGFPNGEIRGQLQSFAANVQLIFNSRCVKCHDSSLPSLVGLLQGQAYDTLVNRPATQSPVGIPGIRVKPFDAAGSVLYNRIAGNPPFLPPAQMPLDGPPYLPQRETNIIKTWIDMGAPND